MSRPVTITIRGVELTRDYVDDPVDWMPGHPWSCTLHGRPCTITAEDESVTTLMVLVDLALERPFDEEEIVRERRGNGVIEVV